MAIVTWRPIKDYPDYEMNSSGDVRRIKSKVRLPIQNPKSGITRNVTLKNEEGTAIWLVSWLQKETFPEMFSDRAGV